MQKFSDINLILLKSLSWLRIVQNLQKQLLSTIDLRKEFLSQMQQVISPVKIAVFTIAIAKTRLPPEEPIACRHVALPLDKEYEDWTQEIYDYFHDADENLVFNYNRKHYLDYLRQHGVFKNLGYRIESYIEPDSGRIIPTHYRKITLEGLRRVREAELKNFYGLSPSEFYIFAGRKLKLITTSNFTLEQYVSYLPKLLKERE